VFAEFSPDGKRVATASMDNSARVWDAASGEALTHPLQHTRTVQCVHFSPDGRSIVTASLDNTARIWDVATAEPLTPPLQHDDQVLHACFSPDGIRVATASADGRTRIWDAVTGLPLTEPLQQTGAVEMVCFSPDSQWIASGCLFPGDCIRVWHLPGAPQPIPSWLPELGEAVAGLSIGPRATTHGLPQQTLTDVRARVTANKETNSFVFLVNRPV
jgi:WD40 repeat protein